MKITPVHSREPKPEYNMPFVPAFIVEGAKLVFVAGCGPIPPYHKHPHVPEDEAEWMRGGIRKQTRKTFEHIQEVLGAAGADLTNIVKLTIFLRDVADQNVVNEISAEMFGKTNPPPRTVVQGRSAQPRRHAVGDRCNRGGVAVAPLIHRVHSNLPALRTEETRHVV